MFLNLLNDEEKSIFLKLAIAVIQADGKLEESEKLFINEYSREMGIQNYNLDEKINLSDLMEKISKKSTDSVKRIFLIELTACATADGEFADSEKSLIQACIKEFGFADETLGHCLKLLNEYARISSELTKYVQEGI